MYRLIPIVPNTKLYYFVYDFIFRFPIWIVSDCRRETDFKYFLEKYKSKVTTVRITATEEARQKRFIQGISNCILHKLITFRGWSWTEGIDDMETECGLDNIAHDLIVDNSSAGDSEQLLEPILLKVKEKNS